MLSLAGAEISSKRNRFYCSYSRRNGDNSDLSELDNEPEIVSDCMALEFLEYIVAMILYGNMGISEYANAAANFVVKLFSLKCVNMRIHL